MEEELALAVKVAVCVVLTEATFAVNVAEDAPDGTVIDAGTATAEMLLERLITRPLFGAAKSVVTVQVSVPVPVIELLAQLRDESDADWAPLP